VAKKFQTLTASPANAANAAMILRMTAALPGLRMTKPRKIPAVRRRLPVAFLPAPLLPVKIGHALQNVGSAVNETRPTQSPPA
jgi:hypothetical protein